KTTTARMTCFMTRDCPFTLLSWPGRTITDRSPAALLRLPSYKRPRALLGYRVFHSKVHRSSIAPVLCRVWLGPPINPALRLQPREVEQRHASSAMGQSPDPS